MVIGDTVIIKFQAEVSDLVIEGEIAYIGSHGLTLNLESGGEEFYEWEEVSSIAVNPDTYQSIGARNG